MFAAAICMWEMLCGERPWARKSPATLVAALLRGERPPLTPTQKLTFLGDMIERCWAHEARRRPTFAQLERDMLVAPWPSSDAALLQLLVFACSPSVAPVPEAGHEAVQVLLATSWGEACMVHWGGTAQSLYNTLACRRTKRFLFSGHTDAGPPGLAAPTKDDGSPNSCIPGVHAWPPPIVHAPTQRQIGHAAAKTLGFARAGGTLEAVAPERVAELLGSFSETLELVFLNGCCSLPLGQQLRERGIRAVVCWSTRVADEAASIFAAAFFGEIARDGSVREAFEAAKRHVEGVTRQVTLASGEQRHIQRFILRSPGEALPEYRGLFGPVPAGVPCLLEHGVDETSSETYEIVNARNLLS